LQDQNLQAAISTQVLKEFANVSLKKNLSKSMAELKTHLTKVQKGFDVVEISVETILAALDITEKYLFSFYDCLIIASAIENDCHTLYSEDLQHGQIIGKKLKIINPLK
jgi:predicted nucleic acid-binding protein